MPRRAAAAASRPASSQGSTIVRRTLSSRSQLSSLSSGKLPPFGCERSGAVGCDVAAQDAVTQQAQAAEVREPWSLRKPGHDRQVQRRHQAGHGQVDVDATLKLTTPNRIPVPGTPLVTPDGPEPPPPPPPRA